MRELLEYRVRIAFFFSRWSVGSEVQNDFHWFTPSKVVRLCLPSISLLGLTAWCTGTFEGTWIAKEPATSELLSVEPIGLSLIQLIANPEKYHGKSVRVVGFVHLEFEGNAIYLHKEDFDRFLPRNALWLSITDEIDKQADTYNNKYVLVEGTFNAENMGHLGMCSGSIEKIKRLEPWFEERKPKE